MLGQRKVFRLFQGSPLVYNTLLWVYILNKNSSRTDMDSFHFENARNIYSDPPKIFLIFALYVCQNECSLSKIPFLSQRNTFLNRL